MKIKKYIKASKFINSDIRYNISTNMFSILRMRVNALRKQNFVVKEIMFLSGSKQNKYLLCFWCVKAFEVFLLF